MAILLGGYFVYSNMQQPAIDKGTSDTTSQTPISSSSDKSNQHEASEFTAIGEITEAMEGQEVKIAGYVTSISGGKGHTFCTVKDPNSNASIKVVLFKSDSEADPSRKSNLEASYNNKDIITIEGKVDVYQEELEVIAKKVY